MKQLSDAEKETLEEDLDDRYTLDAITYYSHMHRALDLWTPNFWRLDAVATKIAEVEKAGYEKAESHSGKRQSQGGKKSTRRKLGSQFYFSRLQSCNRSGCS